MNSSGLHYKQGIRCTEIREMPGSSNVWSRGQVYLILSRDTVAE